MSNANRITDEESFWASKFGSATIHHLRPGGSLPVNNVTNRWTSEVNARLQELVALPKGWDGYDGDPVRFDCAKFAVDMLNVLVTSDCEIRPQLVPCSDGSLQIEWHNGRNVFELLITRPNRVEAFYEDSESGDSDEFSLTSDFSRAAEYLARFNN